MSGIQFLKMHGLGNDFVVIDARRDPVRLDDAAARAIADRRTGVGCDQLIVIEPPKEGGDAFMRIRNADGGEVAACGNATRCVGALLMAEAGRREISIETAADLLHVMHAEGGMVTVDMGVPRLGWRDIPLSREQDTLHLDLSLGPLYDPVAVSMGNPHAVFFVPDAEAIDLATFGPTLENDPLFPERANIGAAQVVSRDRLRLRVWERGAGITSACGTGACAAVVAGVRRGVTDRRVAVMVDGGTLDIEWSDGETGRVRMTGPAATSFSGVWTGESRAGEGAT